METVSVNGTIGLGARGNATENVSVSSQEYPDGTTQNACVCNNLTKNGANMTQFDDGCSSVSQVEEHIVRSPPNGGWGWFCVLGCGLVHFLLGGNEKSFGLIFLVLKNKFDSSASATALVASLVTGLRMLLGPIGSALGNRFGVRKTVIAAGFIYLISGVCSIDPPNIYTLYFTYGVLSGFAGALTYGNSIVIVGKYFEKRRSIATALGSAGSGLGLFCFPILVQALLNEYGYFGNMLIIGALLFNVCVCGALYRPVEDNFPKLKKKTGVKLSRGDRTLIRTNKLNIDNKYEIDPKEVNEGSKIELQSINHCSSSSDIISVKVQSTEAKSQEEVESLTDVTNCLTETSEEVTQSFFLRLKKKFPCFSKQKTATNFLDWSLLKNPTFLLLAIANLCVVLGNIAWYVLLPALAEEKKIGYSNSAFLVSVAGISDMCGRLAIGFVADIPIVRPHRRHLYNLSVFMMGAGCMLLPLGEDYVHFLCMSSVFGCFSGMCISQRSVNFADLLGIEKYASSIGLMLMVSGMGSFTGPFLAGGLKDWLGNYTVSYIFLGIVVWFGALMVLADFIRFKIVEKCYGSRLNTMNKHDNFVGSFVFDSEIIVDDNVVAGRIKNEL